MITHLTWRSELLIAGTNGVVEFPQCALFYCSKQEVPNISLLPQFKNLRFKIDDFTTGLSNSFRLPVDVRYVWHYKGDFYNPVLTLLVGEKVLECIEPGPSQTVWFSVWGLPPTMWPLASKFLEMYVDPKHNVAYPTSVDNIRTGNIGRSVHYVRPADHINLFLEVVGNK